MPSATDESDRILSRVARRDRMIDADHDIADLLSRLDVLVGLDDLTRSWLYFGGMGNMTPSPGTME